MKNETERKPRLWDAEKSDSFIDNIDILKVSEIEIQLDKMLKAENGVSKQEISIYLSIYLSIYIYCLNPVKRTFGQVRRGIAPRKRKNIKQDRKG